MFNSTHTLIGLAIARTGPDRWIPHAVLTAVIASNLPDIDIVAELGSMPSYFEHHRGITHTFIGVPFLSLILAAVMFLFTRNFWRTFVVALIVLATHPALDYANPYGLRPFLPFNGTWYYGDTLFIIDPYIDAVLLTGVLVGRYVKNARRVAAWISMLVVGLYIGARVELRNQAEARLHEFTQQLRGVQIEKSAVLPHMLDPRTWTGIIETNDEIEAVRVDAFRGGGGGINIDPVIMRKAHPSVITERAATARSAAVLLGFARFPVMRVEASETGYRVIFLDFRFYNVGYNTAFAAEVFLDRSLNIVKESLGFNKTID